MSFLCEIRTPPVASLNEAAVLDAWLKQENTWITWDEALFVISNGDTRYAFLSAARGILRQKRLGVGSEVITGMVIATLEAEGDEIPYGRPWGKFARIRPDGGLDI